ncbi:MAG: isoprenylcysteine carboxylmethyltransferase family protein [Sandaracinus sp.]
MDRALDVCFGLTAISWSVLGLVHDDDLPLGVRAVLSAVNVVVGVLFIARTDAKDRAAAADLARALPSVLASGVAYRLALPVWPMALVIAHGLFGLVALGSLATLGRSFAILPARREIVARGPYRLVRHPIYLAELGMLVTACASRGVLAAIGGAALVLAVLVPRILVEERMLGADAAYGAYREKVRFRLVPGVF